MHVYKLLCIRKIRRRGICNHLNRIDSRRKFSCFICCLIVCLSIYRCAYLKQIFSLVLDTKKSGVLGLCEYFVVVHSSLLIVTIFQWHLQLLSWNTEKFHKSAQNPFKIKIEKTISLKRCDYIHCNERNLWN